MENSLAIKQDAMLAQLDIARTALAQAVTIQETKKVLDVVVAAEIYAKRQMLGEEALKYATSIKIEALRKLGELLKDAPKATGGIPYQSSPTGTKKEPVEIPTLADMGLDKKNKQAGAGFGKATGKRY